VLVLQVCGLSAQSLKREKDWQPSLVFVSADFVGLANMISSGNTQAEFSAKIDFDQLFLAYDFGFENQNLTGSSDSGPFAYSSEGRFFRIGPQINFLPYNKDRSNIFFGLSYAHANLSDHIDYTATAENWDDAELEYSNINLKAQWFEASLGMSVRIFGPLFMGYTMRFKMAKSMDTPGELMPFSIPGFGEADKGSHFGFNYYITYRLGFRNKVMPEKPQGQKRLEKVPTNDADSNN